MTSNQIYITGSMKFQGVDYPLTIKVRGHSTARWPKKPYALKLDSKASFFGLPAAKNWALLANFADRSSLRNYLALLFANKIPMAWAAHSHFVDVTLNGAHEGLYLMTEKTEQKAGRVVLPTGGLLLEVNQRYLKDGDTGYVTGHHVSISWADPSPPDLTTAQQQQLQAAVATFESVLYGPGFANPTTGFRKYIDVSSFLDWYWVQELFKNADSDFYSSDYVTWSPGGKFAMGPPWDFDLSAGDRQWISPTLGAPDGWWVRAGDVGGHRYHSSHWIARMFQDPAFAAQARTRWTQLRTMFVSMVNQIPAAANVIRPAALVDWPLWHNAPLPPHEPLVAGAVHGASFGAEVSFLQTWLKTRVAWIDAKTVAVQPPTGGVQENVGVAHIPVVVGAQAKLPAKVSYVITSGSAKAGSDFVAGSGTLTFANGVRHLTVPLRIINDSRPEGPEGVWITLSHPGAGTVIASPAARRVIIRASDQRPDAMISPFLNSGYIGNNVYTGVSAVGQTVTRSVARGTARDFYVRVANDGNVRNTFLLHGSAAVAGSTVRYFSLGTDVTRAMQTSPGYSVSLAPGRWQLVRVRVAALRTATVGTLKTAFVRAMWAGDGNRIDWVKAAARVT